MFGIWLNIGLELGSEVGLQLEKEVVFGVQLEVGSQTYHCKSNCQG